MKNIIAYIKESVPNSSDTVSFDIYNQGPKNKNFEITINSFWHKMNNFKQHVILLPATARSLKYITSIDKESTKNFTTMPGVSKFVEADIRHNFRRTMYNWLAYELSQYIKHGKISAELKEYDDKHVELVINDKQFNDERERKISEMEDTDKLKEWQAEHKLRQEEKIKRDEAEKKAKEEYEEWKRNLSHEDKVSRAHGYGPHHPYEETHPSSGMGTHTMWGWHTGD